MIWLIGLVLTLQAFFYWVLKPLIFIATPILEFRGLGLFALVLGIWLVSGRIESKETL